MSIIDNYHLVKQNIADTAYRCGRNPEDIELVVVTKGVDWAAFNPLYHLGHREFGESRFQEASEKMASTPEDIRWHFIGPLQKNKVKKVISSFELIHSVDSFDLAKKISQCSQEEDIVTRILLEVNISGEETKNGFSEMEARQNFDSIWELPGIKVEGFMTMAPLTDNERIIRTCFARLWDLRDELVITSGGKIHLPHLSMGMSNDYRFAILEGATLLRIGSAIFD